MREAAGSASSGSPRRRACRRGPRTFRPAAVRPDSSAGLGPPPSCTSLYRPWGRAQVALLCHYWRNIAWRFLDKQAKQLCWPVVPHAGKASAGGAPRGGDEEHWAAIELERRARAELRHGPERGPGAGRARRGPLPPSPPPPPPPPP